jgi:hypothetical protein
LCIPCATAQYETLFVPPTYYIPCTRGEKAGDAKIFKVGDFEAKRCDFKLFTSEWQIIFEDPRRVVCDITPIITGAWS